MGAEELCAAETLPAASVDVTDIVTVPSPSPDRSMPLNVTVPEEGFAVRVTLAAPFATVNVTVSVDSQPEARATEIETKSGEIVSGRIEREDDRVVVMRPLTATEDMVTIHKTDIRRCELSKISNMPTGMLNTLKEAQILDLLGYLMSDIK